MIHGIFLMIFAFNAHAANVPFYPRSTQANQDMGGINQDFSDIASCFHNSLTNTIGPKSCPSGQALTGASYNSCGTAFGGTCTAITAATTLNYFIAVDSETLNTAQANPAANTIGVIPLNTLTANTISATIASSSVTIPSGTYYCYWENPVNNQTGITRLWDSTHSVQLGVGSSMSSAARASAPTQGFAAFVLSATSSIAIQGIGNGAAGAPAVNGAWNEIYAELACLKLQ